MRLSTLFAIVGVSALATCHYLSGQKQRRRDEERWLREKALERWEGEGGNLPAYRPQK